MKLLFRENTLVPLHPYAGETSVHCPWVLNKTNCMTNGHRTKCPTFQTAQIMYDLELSRRLCIIKSSQATSRVKNHFRTLRTRTEMDLETLVSSCFNHLTRLVAREDFIIAQIMFNNIRKQNSQ
jgi:hypothetical protein